MNDLIVAEKLAEWQRLKTLVLDSVSSPITRRVYNMALDEFMAWFRQEPRPGFTKATVSAWRVSLEARGLGSSSIIIRMSAIRKLAVEAADNGLLAPELASGITRVKSVKSQGIRVGNWLSLRQAQALLSAPDIATVKGLRDRAILAVLLGCGLRRWARGTGMEAFAERAGDFAPPAIRHVSGNASRPLPRSSVDLLSKSEPSGEHAVARLLAGAFKEYDSEVATNPPHPRRHEVEGTTFVVGGWPTMLVARWKGKMQ